jgi:hypothetical protein
MRLRILLRTKRNPGGIPPGMLRALRYAPYAIRHHWTPKQVDEEIPADVEPYLLDVEALLEDEAKRNERLRRS